MFLSQSFDFEYVLSFILHVAVFRYAFSILLLLLESLEENTDSSFPDILEMMNDLLEDVETLSLAEGIGCVYVGFYPVRMR